MTGSRKRTLMKYRSKKVSRGSSRRVLVRSRRPQRGGASADAPAGLVSDAQSWIENELSSGVDGASLDGANVGLLYNNVKGWLSDEPDKLINALAALREGAKGEMMARFDRDGMDAAREYIDGIGLHSPQLKMQLQMQLNSAAALRRMAEAEAADAGEEADAGGDAICAESPGQCCIDTTNDGDGSEVPAEKLMSDADTIFVKAEGGNFCRSFSSLTPRVVQGFLVRICNGRRVNRSTGEEQAYHVPEDGYSRDNLPRVVTDRSRASQLLDNIYVNARLFGVMNGVMFPLTDLLAYVSSVMIEAVDAREPLSAAARTFVIRRDDPLEERKVIGYLPAAHNRPDDPMLRDALNAREMLVSAIYRMESAMHGGEDVMKLLTPEEDDAYRSMSWVSGMHCEPQDTLIMGRLLPEESSRQLDAVALHDTAVRVASRGYGSFLLQVEPLSHVPTFQELGRRANLICDFYAQAKSLDGQEQYEWLKSLFMTPPGEVENVMRPMSHNAEALSPSVLSAMFEKLRQMYSAAGDNSEEFVTAIGREYNCTPAGVWIDESNDGADGALEPDDEASHGTAADDADGTAADYSPRGTPITCAVAERIAEISSDEGLPVETVVRDLTVERVMDGNMLLNSARHTWLNWNAFSAIEYPEPTEDEVRRAVEDMLQPGEDTANDPLPALRRAMEECDTRLGQPGRLNLGDDSEDEESVADDVQAARRRMFNRAIYIGACNAFEGMTEDERTEVDNADDGVDSTDVIWRTIDSELEQAGLDPADLDSYFDEEELRDLVTQAWSSARYVGCSQEQDAPGWEAASYTPPRDRGPMTLSELDTSGPGDGMLTPDRGPMTLSELDTSELDTSGLGNVMLTPIQTASPGVMLSTATPPLTPLSQSSAEPGDASEYSEEFGEEPPVAVPGMAPSTPPRSPREDPRARSPPGAPTRRRRRTGDMEGGRKTKRRKAIKRRPASKEKKTRGRKSKVTKKQTRRRR